MADDTSTTIGSGLDARISRLASRLRRLQPATVVAVMPGDGGEQFVAPVGRRDRYNRVARTVVKLGALQARCLDKEGHVLDVLDVDQDTEEEGDEMPAGLALAPAGVPHAEPIGPTLAMFAKLLAEHGRATAALVSEAFRAKNESENESTRATLEAMIAVNRVLVERTERIERRLAKHDAAREQDLEATARAVAAMPVPRASDPEDDGDAKATALLEQLVAMAMAGKSRPPTQ